MKKNLLLALSGLVIFAACHNGSNNLVTNPGGFAINGTISGMDSGWVYFGHNDSTGFKKDSTHVKNHQFAYTGKVTEPSLYYVWMSTPQGVMLKTFGFFVEDTTMQINVNRDSITKTVVTGSHVNDLYVAYEEALKPIKNKMDALDKGYSEAAHSNNKAAMDSLEKVYDKLSAEEIDANVAYVQNNPNSVIGAWAIKKMLYNFDLAQLKKVYPSFSPAVQQSSFGKEIKKEMDIMDRTAIGQMAPDFTQNDSTGKPLALASFKGKYVLVDFWASWCGPCRRENPNVVEAYKKFKGKNFTILGVSLDENKEAWVKAVKDDGLAWNHVCDLKGWKNVVAAEYGIRAVPSNFLLDPSGKILAHNLRGEVLQDTLAKILK
ncbi:MAG TPA: TlpA disulfide reductase family protein [Bacteroidia bacterium]|jgi:peroxiredoxin|nr:TlpA disulfide reductase family protein [Bacteroidia bacterium]